ncbi:MAG TPA: copper resistance protein CopC, partial [Ilumatobacteraceae bacterium]
MRRWPWVAACTLSVFALLPAPRVAAHASFIDSNPLDGSVLAESPPVAELRFTEPVLTTASSVRLLRLGSGGEESLALDTAHDGTTLLAEIPRLERGAYMLRFVAVDPADLHKTVGSIAFGVGVAAPPSESGQQVDSSWLSAALRATTDAALLLDIGAIVVIRLLVRRRRDLDHIVRIIAVSSTVVAVGWLAQLGCDAMSVGISRVEWRALLLTSDPGRRSIVGAQLALGAWGTARVLLGARGRAVQAFAANILLLIAGGFVFVAAYGGHAGIGGSFVVGVLLRAAHLMALGMWLGAVCATWMLCRRAPELRSLWRSVSSLAAVGTLVTGVSGLLLSGRVVMTVTALLGTSYGQRIVLKGVLLVVLGVLGAMAASRALRGAEPQRLAIELTIAAVAVIVAATLVGSAPARGERFTAPLVPVP